MGKTWNEERTVRENKPRNQEGPKGAKPKNGDRCDGKILRIMPDKGFGFIGLKSGWDFFFHRSSLRLGDFDALAVGDTVQFTVSEGPKGLRAEDVTIL